MLPSGVLLLAVLLSAAEPAAWKEPLFRPPPWTQDQIEKEFKSQRKPDSPTLVGTWLLSSWYNVGRRDGELLLDQPEEKREVLKIWSGKDRLYALKNVPGFPSSWKDPLSVGQDKSSALWTWTTPAQIDTWVCRLLDKDRLVCKMQTQGLKPHPTLGTYYHEEMYYGFVRSAAKAKPASPRAARSSSRKR